MTIVRVHWKQILLSVDRNSVCSSYSHLVIPRITAGASHRLNRGTIGFFNLPMYRVALLAGGGEMRPKTGYTCVFHNYLKQRLGCKEPISNQQ